MRHALLAALMTLCAAAAAFAAPLGVTVNGVMLDSDGSSDTGWAYEPATSNLILSGVGPFTISGTNESGKVQIGVQEGVTSTVTLSDLTLRATNDYQCVFSLGTNACVSLFLAGTNTLDSGKYRAGLEVAAGRTLSVTNVPGDDTAALFATAGRDGAGIGGGSGYRGFIGHGGTINIFAATVTATSSSGGAGIGGGWLGDGGTVNIVGGTVTATGGNYAAGIGGSRYKNGGTATINGGTVTAFGGREAAGIGGGDRGTGGTVTISGGTVAATGGNYGAGIGGGYIGNAGTVIINDGMVTATGGKYAAAVGGGYKSVGGMVAIAGGTVAATAGSDGAGIGCGTEGDAGTVNINGGMVTATGGKYGAGIGGGNKSAGATVTINDGTVTATGGNYGAGIGGGFNGSGGTVTINGGVVTATGSSNCGAGIGSGGSGGGSGYTGGTVNIAGGIVTATGGDYAAGIGGGSGSYSSLSGGASAIVAISGGTVFAQGGKEGHDIGPGRRGQDTGSNTFTGGTIRLGNASITPAPRNGTKPVFCATVSGFAPGAAVAITGLPQYYGVNDIFADAGGAIHLWLPNGKYTFTAGGQNYTVRVTDPSVEPTGVTVNGEEAAYGPDEPAAGWDFDAETRTILLLGTGPFTLSGTNTSGGAGVSIPVNATNTVTLSNLTLLATNDNQCAFALGTNACVSLSLAGANTLASGESRAGLEIAAEGMLSITNAPGDETGSLSATGGDYGVGIGGGNNGDGGTVTVNGGTVAATGGTEAGGIGGGNDGSGGTVTITGGTVTATGGDFGAGIGGGDGNETTGGDGGTVVISGGDVTATGGMCAAGIGGGWSGDGGTATISGGKVTAAGGYDVGDGGAGIGGGYKGAGGTVTISGGAVTATGGDFGAGIGGGEAGAGGTVTIVGGTVTATGTNGARDIGPGRNGIVSGENTFAGGSIRLAAGNASPAPSNTTEQVFCATVPGFSPGDPVVLDGPPGYGATDIVADGNGIIYLWLPNGTHAFTANGEPHTVTIQDGVGPTGVTVNGEEAAYGPSDPIAAGWSFDATSRIAMLSGPGPFVLSGANTMGGVCIAVTNDVTSTVTLSNLTLKATGDFQCAFALGTNAVVSLVLAGSNSLASGLGRAGLEVAAGRTPSPMRQATTRARCRRRAATAARASAASIARTAARWPFTAASWR
ncbi:MAG: beta strand repeat-containing protein [Kiritimatiellia bacterium]|jgi:hypothetical protein